MIPVTVRLFLGVDILDGSLTDPAPPNADVIRIGNDARYSKTLGGRPFRVIERQYAVFARASGELVIPPVQFQGLVADDSGSNQTFGGLFNQGRRVRTISDQTVLQVAPPNPGSAGRNWLPATNVEINELQPPAGSVVVGEPFTRQIVVSGTGVRAEQLPDLNFDDVPDLRQYPDKVTRENSFTQSTLTGVMGQGIALIPTKPGTVTVPEITIPWWDVASDELKVAVLPGWTLEVAADGSASTTTTNGNAATPSRTGDDPGQQTSTESDSRFWKWSSIILGTLWLLTVVVLVVRHLAVRQTQSANTEEDKFSQAQILEKLHRACRQNNAAGAYSAMHEWVREHSGPGDSPSILDWSERAAKSDLKNAIRELENHLFSAASSNGKERLWSGKALQKCLPDMASLAARRQGEPDPIIADLYPAAEGR